LTGLRARLGELRIPILLIWGAHDRVFPLSYAETARREIPGAQLVVIPHCGHFPHIEAVRPFRGLLSGFLAPVR
jgi:pimeloyl-ACP methyl ester carboxylesterase